LSSAREFRRDGLDCEEDFDDWEKSWSLSKKEQCCEAFNRGCPAHETKGRYSCDGDPFAHPVWRQKRRNWCCQHRKIGCAPPTTTMFFDCNLGLQKWWVQWSKVKQVWCCVNNELGCPTNPPNALGGPTLPPSFCDVDCSHQGLSGSCRKRILFQASTRFSGQDHACREAKSSVLSYCPGCQACPLSELHCTDAQKVTASPLKSAASLENPPQTSSGPFDCLAGFASWERTWPIAKQQWCCQSFKRGCPPEGGVASNSSAGGPDFAMYNCLADKDTCEHSWTVEKKEWCRQHRGVNCTADTEGEAAKASSSTTARSTTSLASTTSTRATRTTRTTTEPMPYDCLAQLAVMNTEWSPHKKQWCCEHERKGCAGLTTSRDQKKSTTTTPYDCNTDADTWELTWSDNRKMWCCDHAKRGCAPSTTVQPYNCIDGFAAWKNLWNDEQKRWCCQHQRRGCEEPYDCDAGFELWAKGWSDAKKDWCCENKKKGCTTVATSLPYDCLVGLANHERSWSEAKMHWCCVKRGKGCPPASTVEDKMTRVPLDCLEGTWASWTSCSATCGGGTRTRSRGIVQRPSPGGMPCVGLLGEADGCNPEPCDGDAPKKVDCVFGEWSHWSSCTATCGGGQRTRNRVVEQQPSGGGARCHGGLEEVDGCNRVKCEGS